MLLPSNLEQLRLELGSLQLRMPPSKEAGQETAVSLHALKFRGEVAVVGLFVTPRVKLFEGFGF